MALVLAQVGAPLLCEGRQGGDKGRKSHCTLHVGPSRAPLAPGTRRTPSVQEQQPEAIKHPTRASAFQESARWVGFA